MWKMDVCGQRSMIVRRFVFSLSSTRRAFSGHRVDETLEFRCKRWIDSRGANASRVLCVCVGGGGEERNKVYKHSLCLKNRLTLSIFLFRARALDGCFKPKTKAGKGGQWANRF